jgi:hypothetical protein
LQECVRRHRRVGLLVRPIFCAGPTQGVRWDDQWATAGGSWLRAVTNPGMDGKGKAAAGCEVHSEQ